MTNTSTTSRRAVLLIALSTLLIGYLVGRAAGGDEIARASVQTTSAVELMATATRETELLELSDLRTQVARTPAALVCTPAATSTPEATPTPTTTPTPVPPVASGQSLSYAGDWTVAATDITMMPSFGMFTATGVYARISLTIVNGGTVARAFPYEDLVLRDALGNPYLPDSHVRNLNEAGWFSPFPPSLPTDGQVIFDIASDAEGPFVLESTADPTFRVSLEVQLRG